MVLDLFLVSTQLPLQLVQHQVHGRHHVLMTLVGDKVVLVLGLHDELDVLLVVVRLVEIDRHLDHRQAIEDIRQLQGLLADGRLVGVVQMSMARRNLHLHGHNSFYRHQ